MMYVIVPEKPKIESLSDIKEYSKIAQIFHKHGFAISFFGKQGVSFHKTTCVRQNPDGTYIVPVNARYHFDRKDFALFIEMIIRLDDAESKLTNSIKSLSGALQMRA